MLKMMKNVLVVLVGVMVANVWASPVTPLVKAGTKCVGRLGVRFGVRAAGNAVARGGAKLAAVQAERMAVRTAGKAVVRGGTKLATVQAERMAARTSSSTLASVSKEVTPKRILATGGAVAAVVGTHEVADGVQSMGQGVGKAVAENPGIAADVADRVIAPIRWIVWAVLVVVAWMLWPLVRLVRNGVAWWATGKMRKMEVPREVTCGNSAQSRVDSQSGRIGIQAVLALALLAGLVVLGIYSLNHRGVGSGTRGGGVDVAKIRAEYEKAVQNQYEAFLGAVGQTTEAEFGKVKAGIDGAVKQFGTMSRCAGLVKTMVLDKLGGGTRTSDSIRADLEADYYRGLYDARDHVVACVGTLRSNLEAARRTFGSAVKRELALEIRPGDEAYDALLTRQGEEIEGTKRALAEKQLDAGVGVALEAYCFRETVAVVTKVLGKTVVRQAGTMAAGAGASVADGPLPIGDCLAVVAVAGSTVWTAVDVYQATKTLPRDLARILEETTDVCAGQCRREAEELGQEVFRRYLAALDGV